MVPSRTTFIYALIDPNDQQVHYIGKADNPHRRLASHLSDPKSEWLKALVGSGSKPELSVLEEVPLDQWQQKERDWITFYGLSNLDNFNSGGGGKPTLELPRAKVQIVLQMEDPAQEYAWQQLEEMQRKGTMQGFLRQMFIEALPMPAQPKANAATTRAAPKPGTEPRYVKDEE